ncbi:MAG TPA: hypothetical protein VEK38_03375, partial [Candidatus Bathyarchaeia archaeon]|nr:hypothetical protein [Candidatus Bathyarchaeia archaeon]
MIIKKIFLFVVALITTHAQIYGMITEADFINHINSVIINGNQEYAHKILKEKIHEWAAHSSAGDETVSIDSPFQNSVKYNAQDIIEQISSFPTTTTFHKYLAFTFAVEDCTESSLSGALYLLTNNTD